MRNLSYAALAAACLTLAAACLTLAGCAQDRSCDPALVQVGMSEKQVVAVCGSPTVRDGGQVSTWKDVSGTRIVQSNLYMAYDRADGTYDLVVLKDGRVDHASRNPPLPRARSLHLVY